MKEIFAFGVLCSVLAASSAAFAAMSHHESAVEFPEETKALVKATEALFVAIETVEWNDHATRSIDDRPQMLAPVSLESVANPALAPFRYGAVADLTGYRINWYPMDTLLGAVDFMGTSANSKSLVCGYVTWDMSDKDAPEIDQLVATYLDLGELTDARPEEAHAALLNANCAYGDVDLNFTVFQSTS